MNIAVITGASSGHGVKFLEAVLEQYLDLDEYRIIARRKIWRQNIQRKRSLLLYKTVI